MPKVSVIMGMYNCESTVAAAIESVIEQTYADWQLIMCDDASTDNTYRIAKEYADKYPDKIKLLKNEKNLKLADSLNRCLEVADGDYIARLDADDVNLPKRYEKQVDFLDAHSEYELVSCMVIVYDENGDRGIRGIAGEPPKDCMYTGLPFVHPTIMMRKSAYDKLGWYRPTKTGKGQDADLWFRFYAADMRGYVLAEPLYKYHESITDLQRRTLKQSFYRAQGRYRGLRLLKAPLRYYIYCLKPIAAALTPNFILYRRRNRLEKK